MLQMHFDYRKKTNRCHQLELQFYHFPCSAFFLFIYPGLFIDKDWKGEQRMSVK